MNITTLKLIRGAIVFMATLLLLYGAQFLWQKYYITVPLNRELQSVEGVQSVAVEKPSKINEPVNINISFNNISNFQKTYAQINEKAVQALKNKTYKINIKDNGNDELEKLYFVINMYVEKALIDGSFPSLAEKSNEMAKSIGAESNILIDDKYIYLHITKGDKSLYKLVSRQSRGVGELK